MTWSLFKNSWLKALSVSSIAFAPGELIHDGLHIGLVIDDGQDGMGTRLGVDGNFAHEKPAVPVGAGPGDRTELPEVRTRSAWEAGKRSLKWQPSVAGAGCGS